MGNIRSILLTLVLFLPTGGCCYLADWAGCYPDSPLVTQGYQTPTETLDTFKAAVLHGDVDRIYFCLSGSYKKRLGLDNLTTHLAWPRLQEKVPYIRSLFRAEVTSRSTLPNGQRSMILAVAGYRFQLVLTGEPCVKVLALAEDSDGKLVIRRILDDDLPGGLARVLKSNNRGALACILDQPQWREDIKEQEKLTEITKFSVAIEWKIDELKPITD